MTDTLTPILMPDLTDDPVPSDNMRPCPECGKLCVSGMGLARHRLAAHGVVDTEGKVQCEVEGCGAWMIPGSLGRHMRNTHNVYRRRRPGPGRPVGSKNKPKLEVDPVIDERPKKLPPLTADQITRAAAEALWPRGIPHDKLPALLRWNNQTFQFLTEVSQ